MKKYRRKPVKKDNFICRGGPFAGHVLWLSEGSTGVISVNGQTGKYVVENLGFSDLVWIGD